MNKIRKLLRNAPRLFVIATVATIVFVISATFAWFSTTDAKDNNFHVDFNFEVNLVDIFKPPTDLKPEQLVEKKVTAKNTGDLDAFVRVMVFPVAVNSEGVPLSVGSEVEVKYHQLNTTDWLYGQDGYFYYLSKLAPGQEAPLLFDGVTLVLEDDAKTKEMYDQATFKIEVKSEAVDARKSEYRYSWWGTERDVTQTVDPLKMIDTKLQTAMTN